MNAPAIVILGAGALETARRIQKLYADSQVYALQGRVAADVPYAELGAQLRELYASGTPIVALCAAGIVIRCVAPLLTNKGVEPPVLAVAEDGSAVVPLLGGLAGVNVMAREIAAALNVSPAITTSGELRFGTCVLNPPEGYTLADIGQGKRFVSDLLAGESTRVEGEAPWLDDAQLPRSASARLAIRVTPRAWDGREDELVIHPRSVVAAVSGGAGAGAAARSAAGSASAGVAASTGAASAYTSSAGIAANVRAALNEHGLATLSLAALLAASDRITDPALAEAAASLNVPLRFAQTRPEDGEPPSNLLHAALRIPYETLHDDPDAGVALALTPLAIDANTIGMGRGRLTVIGLGPRQRRADGARRPPRARPCDRCPRLRHLRENGRPVPRRTAGPWHG
ncbi:cobalamin biosynthesis protein CbiG [Paraburkholderia bryophila]|uniref:Cobalamin biosynthesis protein CbiG n=1 Tax=Paraburkholderia bryophila TaxID=420952 RepID=A0A7Y9W9Q4_9BURK|nr:cobalamin biosynthesis protein CbiG [Paraburkholderia bryophila]